MAHEEHSSAGDEQPAQGVAGGAVVAAPLPSGSVAERRRPWLAVFAAINALAAGGGATALIIGAADFGERIDERLPFDSLVLAGVALATIVAIPLATLAWSAWTGAARTDDIAATTGLLLIAWIVIQVVLLRAFSLFQLLYLGIGAWLVAASGRIRLGPFLRGSLLISVGAAAVAVGVGLAPHLIENGITAVAALSVVLMLAGVALAVRGVRTTVRERRRPVQLVGGVGAIVVMAMAVSIVAPAVAATNVPASSITSTPSSLGLDHESVTLTAADGVELAAWYLPGTDDAAVVVMHGAGSTRSDVLDQSAVLAASGYGVLLLDARGHGESHGTAMDFGWAGDLDIVAGIDYLASRTDVHPGRIGIVGFSMGGEEAIGAAAADPRISAVVAEGATARRAADKAWLSDVYGWRGWLQERLEHVQDAVTAYLGNAEPPIPLRSAVAAAVNTPFLLITAGNVSDERHAAHHIQTGAPERVTIWTVDGADHTGGFELRPEEWGRRIVAFLDEHLR